MKLSKTSLGEYCNCQRQFFHSRIKKTDRDSDWKKGKALSFGAAFAECQDIFRNDYSKMTTSEVIRVTERNELGVTEAGQLLACLRLYYANIRPGEIVEKSEVWLEHPTLVGKLDKIVKINGKKYILEDKTSSDINRSVLSTSLLTDPQLCLYASCADQFEADGILYRVVEKPKQRRKKEESLIEYTQRCTSDFFEIEFSFNELQIDECLKQYNTAKEEIEAKVMEDEFLCNKQNCVKFGSACAWYSRCHGKTYSIANGDW